MFDFIPEPKTVQQAAFQTRVMDRAVTLWSDGYRYTYGGDLWPDSAFQQNLYAVTSPEGDTYTVNTLDNTCECECCVKNRFCKHLMACKLLDKHRDDERDAARVEEYERVRANAEVHESLLPNSYPF